MPPVLRRYCNVKKPFMHVVGAKPGGMAAMLQKLELPLTGHHHRGIDDARNIAKIVAHLARKVSLDVTGGLQSTGLTAAREAELTAELEANAVAWAALTSTKSTENERKQHVLATQQWLSALPQAEQAFVEQLKKSKKSANKATFRAAAKSVVVEEEREEERGAS